jgi:type IV pilus assembly protein PilV
MKALSSRARSARRGYTAVEVMLSIAVLAVGATGVMAMQKASVQGNEDARNLDIANSIARQWVERLRRDSVTWTKPDDTSGNSVTTGAANWSGNTFLISTLGGSPGTWFFSPSTADGYSPASDILGRDVTASDGGTGFAGAVFCTEMKGDWLVQDQLMRVTVHVFWLRQLFTAPTGQFCVSNAGGTTSGQPQATDADRVYHSVYVTTAVRRNPGQ